MKKTDIKPGMRVKNVVTGSVAVVRRGNHRGLRAAHRAYVAVQRRTGGTPTGKMLYPLWYVPNLVRA